MTPSKEEMRKVVETEECIQIVENTLKQIDKKGLTENGTIKKYRIDYDSIEWNPMGGIIFDIYINDDDDLYINFDLAKRNDALKSAGYALSVKLDSILRGDNNE